MTPWKSGSTYSRSAMIIFFCASCFAILSAALTAGDWHMGRQRHDKHTTRVRHVTGYKHPVWETVNCLHARRTPRYTTRPPKDTDTCATSFGTFEVVFDIELNTIFGQDLEFF